MKQSNKRIVRYALVFFVIVMSVYLIGYSFSRSRSNHDKGKTDIQYTGAYVQQDPVETQKLRELIIRGQKADLNVVEAALGVKNWDKQGIEEKNDVVSLIQYFPKGQNISKWSEAMVYRSFPQVKVKDPVPFTYDIYQTWLKMKLPDFQLSVEENKNDIILYGYSNAGQVYICSKIYRGQIKDTINILQYTFKPTSKDNIERIIGEWKYKMKIIKTNNTEAK